MTNDTRVPREWVGWWPLSDLTMDGVPITDETTVELICLPQDVRPTQTVTGFTWKAGHRNGAGQICVWLDAATGPTREVVYGRPIPAAPEYNPIPLDGAIFRT
jgi:hypothetical protein